MYKHALMKIKFMPIFSFLSSAKEILFINYASEKHDNERDTKEDGWALDIFSFNLNFHSLE